MKKNVLTIIAFVIIANVSAQFKVDSLGNVGIWGTIGTITNVPVTFKVNNSIAGFTGNSGNTNVAFGFGALPNPIAECNTAYGYDALHSNTDNGNYNTAIGIGALYSNTKGWYNVANGSYALNFNTTGVYNVAIGHEALYYNTTGSCNIAIGYETGFYGLSGLNNATVIGCNAVATGSNQVIIGNSGVKSIGGFADWSNFSDGRAKKNIKADVPGLDFINRLQPVTYNLDLDAVDNLLGIDKMKKDRLEKDMPQELKAITEKSRKAKQEQVQTGFVAQDVEKTAKSIGYNFSGVNVDESGIYSLSYAEFVVPLVKAVQELSEKNDLLVAQNNKQQAQIDELTGLINKLLGKDTEPGILRSESSSSSVTGLSGLATDTPASLEQNIPNPFNHTTIIHYTLPETCTSAKILIANIGGHVIQQLPLSVSGGHDSITIKGGSLQAGVYLYSLICDGKVVDTKRMILTK